MYEGEKLSSRAIVEWLKKKFGVSKTQIAEVIRSKEVVHEAWLQNSHDEQKRVTVCKTISGSQ